MASDRAQLTTLLQRWHDGDRSVLDELDPSVYRRLRRQAGGLLRGERPGHTLTPTAVVHEAYLLFDEAEGMDWQDREHFFSFMARLMRRVLVHHARAKAAKKRGGNEERVTLDDDAALVRGDRVDVLDLNRALDELENLDARQARIVELRYFIGMKNREIADELSLSPATVKRDWSTARAWLARRLSTR